MLFLACFRIYSAETENFPLFSADFQRKLEFSVFSRILRACSTPSHLSSDVKTLSHLLSSSHDTERRHFGDRTARLLFSTFQTFRNTNFISSDEVSVLFGFFVRLRSPTFAMLSSRTFRKNILPLQSEKNPRKSVLRSAHMGGIFPSSRVVCTLRKCSEMLVLHHVS